jgi:hypothetical protein
MLVRSFNLSQSVNYAPDLFCKKRFKSNVSDLVNSIVKKEKTLVPEERRDRKTLRDQDLQERTEIEMITLPSLESERY